MTYRPFDPRRDRDHVEPDQWGEPVWQPRITPGKRTLTSRLVQRKAAGPEVRANPRVLDDAAASSSAPLPAELAARFGGSLGTDVSDVRVHTGAAAAAAAQSVSARAYAQGRDIYFADSAYKPSSAEGQRLIAHEVAHTVQQSGGRAAGPQYELEVSQPGDALELEADVMADAMVRGAPASISGRGHGIQRDPTPDDDVRVAPTGVDASQRFTLRGGTHRFAALMNIYESGDFGEGGLTPSTVVGSNGETLEQVYQLYRAGRVGSENGMFQPNRAAAIAQSIRERGFLSSDDAAGAGNVEGHGTDGLHALYLLPAEEVESNESIDTRLDGESGIRGFITGGHVPLNREHRRERNFREHRLENMQHDGAGNWTNADGTPVAGEAAEQLRTDLVENSRRRGVLRGEAMNQYQAFINNSSNPAVDAETWAREHRTDEQRAHRRIREQRDAMWQATDRHFEEGSPARSRTNSTPDTTGSDDAVTVPTTRPRPGHASRRQYSGPPGGSATVPLESGASGHRVAMDEEVVAPDGDTLNSTGFSSCAGVAVHSEEQAELTLGHVAENDGRGQYAHIRETLSARAAQGGTHRALIRMDPEAESADGDPASRIPASHEELVTRLRRDLQSDLGDDHRVVREGDELVVRDADGRETSRIAVGVTHAPRDNDGSPRLQEMTVVREGVAIHTDGDEHPRVMTWDEAQRQRPPSAAADQEQPSVVTRRTIPVGDAAEDNHPAVVTRRTIPVGGAAEDDHPAVVTRPTVPVGDAPANASDSASEEAADPAEDAEQTPRRRLRLADGRLRYTRTDERQRFRGTRAAGTETRERSTEGGAFVDEQGGLGVALGSTDSVEVRDGDSGASRSTSRQLQVTDRRLAASQTTERGVSHGSLNASTKTSADGSFSIALEPQLDHDPPDYLMTFTCHLGIGLEGGAGRSRTEGGSQRATGRASVNASASSDVVTTRRISVERAREYMAAADRHDAGDHSSTLPEFGRLARLRAAWAERDMAQNSAALLVGDAQTASQMAAGESVSMTLEATAGADGTLGLQNRGGGAGASVTGGASVTYRRQVSIERLSENGRNLVQVQVSYMRTDEHHYGASGSLMGASAGANRQHSEGRGEMVRVVLNPDAADYDARYAEVMAALTPEQLRSIASSDRFRVTHRRSNTTESDGGDASVGVGPASVTLTGRSGHQEQFDSDEEGNQTAEVVGESESGLRADAGDTRLAGWRSTARATASASEAGTELDLDREEQTTDVLRSAGDALEAATDRSAGENAIRAASQSPLAHLRGLLSEEHRRLERIHLEPADVETLVQRAGNVRRWRGCTSSVEHFRAWYTVGTRLRAAGSMPVATEEQRYTRSLRIARLITRWVERSGDEPRATVERALYHWGDRRQIVSDARVGRREEWPPELTETQARCERYEERVGALDTQLAAMVNQPNAEARARRVTGSLRASLHVVQGEIRQCDDFESEDARNQLMDHIDQLLNDISQSNAVFAAQLRAHEANSDSDSDQSGDGDAETSPEPAIDADTQLRLLNEQGNRIIHRLLANKRTERSALSQASADLQSFFLNREAIRDRLHELHDLYVGWYSQVQRLRALYTQAGVDPESWCVSRRPYDQRNRRREPDIDRFIRLYMVACEGTMYGGGRVARAWRGEYNSY